MGLLFDLLDNPYVPWVVGLGALLLGYRFLADRLRLRVPGVPSSGEDLLSRILGPRFAAKALEREIARLKKQDNHLAAGRLLEDSGRLAEAAEAYLEGREYWAAASTLEKLGRAERAAELYLQAGDHKKGAALFTSAGKPARAAALFSRRATPWRRRGSSPSPGSGVRQASSTRRAATPCAPPRPGRRTASP
jgi:tetratricopeptide (TPR) repeat protein